MTKSPKITEVDGIRVGDRVRGVSVGQFVVVGFEPLRGTPGMVAVLNCVSDKGEIHKYRVRLTMDCITPVNA